MRMGPSCVVLIISLVVCVVAVPPFYPYSYCGAPSTVEVTKTNLTLLLVQTITRHGDRTSLTPLPGFNPQFMCNLTSFMFPSLGAAPGASLPRLYRKNYLLNREVIPGNCNFGQLTERGYDQHVLLGSNLRNLYVDTYNFLSPELNTSEIWIRSTDIYRTVQSAQANIYGLFPGTGADSDNIPVVDMYTMDLALENMFSNDAVCPREVDIQNQVQQQPEYVQYQASLTGLQTDIAQALGVSTDQLPEWDDIFDAFSVVGCYNASYPKGITQEMVDQVAAAANWEYNYTLANATLVRLWIGTFLGELVEAIQDKIAGNLEAKYMMYSGHDTTLAPLTTALGVYDGNWPPYASHVELELWSGVAGDYYVQVKYQGIAQTLSGCNSTLCPLKQFLVNINPYIPVDFAKECAEPQTTKRRKIVAR